jgi:hypothetical protein
MGKEQLGNKLSLIKNHMVDECLAMAKYALSSGMKVPSIVIQTVEMLGMPGGEDVEETNEPTTEPNKGNTKEKPKYAIN